MEGFSEGKNFPIESVNAEAFEKAQNRFEHSIQVYLDYRYDLPPKKLEPGDEDYYRFMCRNNAIHALILNLEIFLKQDIKNFPYKDESLISSILEDEDKLYVIGKSTTTRLKTEQEMADIHYLVSDIVEKCQKILDMNKPEIIEAAA